MRLSDYNKQRALPQIPSGLVVRISRSHRDGRGSIPRLGRCFCYVFALHCHACIAYILFCSRFVCWSRPSHCHFIAIYAHDDNNARKNKNSLRAGFEPAREDPIGFQVQRLNHSAITACVIWVILQTLIFKTDRRENRKSRYCQIRYSLQLGHVLVAIATQFSLIQTQCRHGLYSSVGQSVCLVSRRSRVRIPLEPPQFYCIFHRP